MKKAALYTRVSTLEQVQFGYSIGEQKERLKNYAQSQDFSIVDIYSDEGISGKSLIRPAMERLINDIKANKINIVLIYKLDRLSRRVKDVLELVELFDNYNVTLFSLNENIDLSSPFGRASLKMSATFSEFERETIVERMQMGKSARAKMGKYACPGKCPFGYRLNREKDCLDVHEREAEAIREMFDKYIYDGLSFRKLYEYMKAKYSDIKFFSHDMSCKDVIERPLYAGYFNYKGNELIKATNVPPIISYETYLQAQERVKKNTTKRERDNSPYLLTGLMLCAKCGHAYVGKCYKQNRLNKDGKLLATYSRTSYGCMARVKADRKAKGLHCDNDIFPSQLLEEYVEKAVQNLKFNEFVAPIASTGLIDKLMLENSDYEKQKQRLLDVYMDSAIDKETFILRTSEIDKKIKRNEKIILNEKDTIAKSPTVSIEYLKERQKAYASCDKKEKRTLLQLLIKHIVINGQKITITWNVK